MKKVTLFALVALLAISFSVLAIAAPASGTFQAPGNLYCPYYRQYNNNLTDDQKAQIATWQQQALDQRKQVLQKQVEWGWITQAQADQQISRMQQRSANGDYGYGPMGYGMMGRTGSRGCW